MADLRRRKPDDDKHTDEDNPNVSKIDGTNSDDEQAHHKKPASGLATAESSDHVNIFFSVYTCWCCYLTPFFSCLSVFDSKENH